MPSAIAIPTTTPPISSTARRPRWPKVTPSAITAAIGANTGSSWPEHRARERPREPGPERCLGDRPAAATQAIGARAKRDASLLGGLVRQSPAALGDPASVDPAHATMVAAARGLQARRWAARLAALEAASEGDR